MEMQGVIGAIYRFMEWVLRLALNNVLWVVTSIPLGFAILLIVTDLETTSPLALLLLILLVPFTVFPSTSALMGVCRQWVTGQVSRGVIASYFRIYAENFRQSVIVGFCYMILGVLIYMNFRLYYVILTDFQFLAIVFIAMGIFLIITLLFFFPMQVHLKMSTWQLLKYSFILALGYPVYSILLFVVNGGILMFTVMYLHILLIPLFLVLSIAGVYTFWSFMRLLERMQAKLEQFEQKENISGT